MNKELGEVIKSFFGAFLIARVYTCQHPRFLSVLEDCSHKLSCLLERKGTIVIGIIGEEITAEDEIFFNLSKRYSSLLADFKRKGIEKISLKKGLSQKELLDFFSLFISLPENVEDLSAYFLENNILHIEVGNIYFPPSLSKEKAPPEGNFYRNALRDIASSFSSLLSGGEVNFSHLRFILFKMYQNFAGRYQEFLKLGEVKDYDTRIFIHLLNVSSLALFFSSRLGFTQKDCLDIAMAGLFHDIGKLYINRKVIVNPTSLSEKEFFLIKSHTILGAEILLNYRKTLGLLPAIVAFEHHRKYDNSGYPKLKFNYPPHIASFIVSICDVYDALSQRRSYKRDYPPEFVYNIMTKEKGSSFHPYLLEKFFTYLGVWPVGTIVSLTDGRVAIVRENTPQDIFSPRVEIVSGNKKEFLDLRKIKTIKIEKSLNPQKEAKPYIKFI